MPARAPRPTPVSENPALQRLVTRQTGLVARRQLTRHGVDWDAVDRQVRAGRWSLPSPRVVATTTGPISPAQRRWLAVLHAGPRSMLGSLSAAAEHGLTGWERRTVTVWVDDELAFEPVEGVRFFRSRRPFDVMAHSSASPPAARLEPAVLLWAGYDAERRAAVGVLAAAVQQRLTTADRLLGWVDLLRPLRRAPLFRSILTDVATGSHSATEVDLVGFCRATGLPVPDRQVPRDDGAGQRRRTDAEWSLPDGTTLVLEVDGAWHLDEASWSDDVRRQRRLTVPGRRVVVACTGYELRHEPDRLAEDLRALGIGALAAGPDPTAPPPIAAVDPGPPDAA